MGKIQCVSLGRTYDYIEKSLNNVNTPLDKKINNEYKLLKHILKHPENNSLNQITGILTTGIPIRKRLERFIKWYKMANIDNSLRISSTMLHEIKESHTEPKGSSRDSNIKNNSTNKLGNINNINLDLSYSKLSHPRSNNQEDCNSHFVETESKLSSIDHIEVNSFNLYGHYADETSLTYERALRGVYNSNKALSLERTSKGPPESFRWLSWVICADISEDRPKEVFEHFYSDKLNDKTDSQIKKDLNRTLAEITGAQLDLANFNYSNQSGDNPSHNYLYRVLRAFANNDPEIAYCQGMNFIAGFLLIASDFNESESFYMLASLFSDTFSDRLGMRGFFSEDFHMLKAYMYIFDIFFEKKMPQLRTHFNKLEIPKEVWISKWIQTLYTINLPIDATYRVWDCILSEGLEFLIGFSLALVKHFEDDLIKMEDSFDVIDYFKKVFSYKNSKTNFIPKHTVNIEEIIINTKKMQITKFQINQLKLEFEEKFKIDLSYLNKKYELNSNSLHGSIKSDDLRSVIDPKEAAAIKLKQSIICTTINKSTGLVSNSHSNSNAVAIKEESDEDNEIDINNKIKIELVDGEEEEGDDFNVEEFNINDKITRHTLSIRKNSFKK